MGLYRSTLRGSLFGQTVDVIHGWTTTTSTNATDAGTIAQRVATFWDSLVMLNLVSQYQLNGCDVIGMDVGTVAATYAHTSVGAVIGAPAPAFVVGNVHLSTGLRGRSYNGRFGIPGLPRIAIDATDANDLASGSQGTLQTAIGSFITAVNTGAPNPVLAVVSTISGGTPRPVPIGTNVTVATLRTALGSRVSRKD